MDPILVLALGLLAVGLGGAAVVSLHRQKVKQAGATLQKAAVDLDVIESTLRPFIGGDEYIPERIRRPLEATVTEVTESTLPKVAVWVPRFRDNSLRSMYGAACQRALELRQVLTEHNLRYVQRTIAAHSALLFDVLKADEAQRAAIVKDDERNLVIAGAGSGKTRTIVGRVRFLLERGVRPASVLAVTFTNKATEEMGGRLREMGVPVADRASGGVTVSTLHALGKRVVQASMHGPVSVADDRWTTSLVAAALGDTRSGKDPTLARLYLNAITNFHRNEDEYAPASGDDRTYRTLRGEHVRSIGERIIADFLLTNHVPYRYEAKASWAQVDAKRNAYHPDFTLLGTGACIEYWGVSRNGEVPAGWATSSAEYRSGMEWKREEFRRSGKTLLEFYDYERTEGTLGAALLARLPHAGIPLRPMTFDELEETVGDMKYIGSAIEKLLVEFIANARSILRTPEEIRDQLRRRCPRVHHFGLLGIAVLERYQAALAEEGRIDFADMLHRAADILETGANPLPAFEHVLVDEFQDTSAAMARLLKALLAINKARLFAVGDDWQAIYGFAGGDVDHIINFETHFGPASTTMLDVNYRSPAVIVEAGAALIARNKRQLPKQVVLARRERGEAYVYAVPDDDAAIVDRTISLVSQELRGCHPDRILVLSRTNHMLDDIVEACRRRRIPVANPYRGVQGVRILSAHKAKGLEADVVVVANASDHLFGFPSKVENPDVLEPVRMSASDAQGEERRLFYVVITRAMKRLHLIARQGLPSPYLWEIEGASRPIPLQGVEPSHVRAGTRFDGTFHVERLYRLTDKQKSIGIRQSGVLATPLSRFSFTSWAPFNLDEGALYEFSDVLKEHTYRDQQRVKLDERTREVPRLRPAIDAPGGSRRELRPHPPPSHQPRPLERS